MRKIILFFLFIAGFYTVDAQRFLGAFAFGGNLSQVDGDEVFGYKKLGLNVGVASFLPIHEKWFVSLEVAFSQKGAYQKYPREQDLSKSLPYYNLRLNYLEIPFLVHFEDKHFVMIGTGFSFNRLVGAKEVEWGIPTITGARNGIYSINDINWMVDVRFRIYKSLRLNFRYSYSLGKIRTRTYSDFTGYTWSRNQFNNILTLRFVYTFNETINPEDEEEN